MTRPLGIMGGHGLKHQSRARPCEKTKSFIPDLLDIEVARKDDPSQVANFAHPAETLRDLRPQVSLADDGLTRQ